MEQGEDAGEGLLPPVKSGIKGGEGKVLCVCVCVCLRVHAAHVCVLPRIYCVGSLGHEFQFPFFYSLLVQEDSAEGEIFSSGVLTHYSHHRM